MKARNSFWVVALSLLYATQLTADFAPESIDGMVLRTSSAVPSVRQAWQRTYLFEADGTYVQLLSTNLWLPATKPSFSLKSTSKGGSYTYVKTGANTATLKLVDPLYLEFSSLTEGGVPPTFFFSLIPKLSAETAPAMNISLRGVVTPDRPLIGGFVVPNLGVTSFLIHNINRDVLIRVIGPSLAPLDVEDFWADPDFKLYRDGKEYQSLGRHYGDWWGSSFGNDGTEYIFEQVSAFESIFEHVGAFPLLDGSKDAAQVERLPAGAYTVVAKAEEGDPGGEALIEVYFLP